MKPRSLTPMQQLVVELLANGHSVKETAGIMVRSINTVNRHLTVLRRKFQVHNTVHLMAKLFRERIFQ